VSVTDGLISANSIDPDDTYRDIDTLQRFMGILNSKNEKILEIKRFKTSVIATENAQVQNSDRTSDGASDAPAARVNEKPNKSGHKNNFVPEAEEKIKIGSMVSLKSNPTKKGAVIEINKQGSSTSFTLFIDGKSKPFYLSQLQPLEQD